MVRKHHVSNGTFKGIRKKHVGVVLISIIVATGLIFFGGSISAEISNGYVSNGIGTSVSKYRNDTGYNYWNFATYNTTGAYVGLVSWSNVTGDTFFTTPDGHGVSIFRMDFTNLTYTKLMSLGFDAMKVTVDGSTIFNVTVTLYAQSASPLKTVKSYPYQHVHANKTEFLYKYNTTDQLEYEALYGSDTVSVQISFNAPQPVSATFSVNFLKFSSSVANTFKTVSSYVIILSLWLFDFFVVKDNLNIKL